jgi:hypothetical protein
MPEPATFDARHEAYCRDEERRREGLTAYYEQLDTEDLLINLRLATGVDRAVILELLEARGHENAVDASVQNVRCRDRECDGTTCRRDREGERVVADQALHSGQVEVCVVHPDREGRV